jgi:glycerol-3-phosphate acyltransferase PlsY
MAHGLTLPSPLSRPGRFMVGEAGLLILAGYLLGSIPSAYLAGRWIKGLDLSQYGSGTVSGSMVWEHVARWALVPVGLFDIAKAAFPTWLGLQLGLGTEVATAAGLAAVAGHNWSVFLRLKGGRGLGSFLGVLLVIFPWGGLWLLLFLAVGWRLGDSAPWALLSIATLPLLAQAVGEPGLMVPVTGVMLLLAFGKRLEANRRPLPPPGPERRRVMLYRLLLDRDIRDHQRWIRRKPGEET